MRSYQIGVVLFVSLFAIAPCLALGAELDFFLTRGDTNHDGTPDQYNAGIQVQQDNAQSVQLITSSGEAMDFAPDGQGWFNLEDDQDTFPTVDALNSAIDGSYTLRLTQSGGQVTDYTFTMSPVSDAVFPALPTVDTTPADIDQNYDFTWQWAGSADAMHVKARIPGVDFVAEDDSLTGSLQVGTSDSYDVDFAPYGGQGDFDVEYGNVEDLSQSGSGQAITSLSLASGSDLFAGPNDTVREIDLSADLSSFRVVPEPTTMALLGLGLVALRRRTR